MRGEARARWGQSKGDTGARQGRSKGKTGARQGQKAGRGCTRQDKDSVLYNRQEVAKRNRQQGAYAPLIYYYSRQARLTDKGHDVTDAERKRQQILGETGIMHWPERSRAGLGIHGTRAGVTQDRTRQGLRRSARTGTNAKRQDRERCRHGRPSDHDNF